MTETHPNDPWDNPWEFIFLTLAAIALGAMITVAVLAPTPPRKATLKAPTAWQTLPEDRHLDPNDPTFDGDCGAPILVSP